MTLDPDPANFRETAVAPHAPQDAVLIVRADGIIRFANAVQAHLLGCTPRDAVGCSIFGFVNERAAKAIRSDLEAVLRDGKPRLHEFLTPYPGGRARWLCWRIHALGQGMDGQHEVLFLGEDITLERRDARIDRIQQLRYQGIYERSPAILHSIDEQGRLLAVSDAWLDLLGYTRDEVIGRRSVEFLDEESRRRAVAEVIPLFHTTGRIENIPYRMCCKDGSTVDVLLSAIIDGEPATRHWRSIAVLSDVTGSRRIEATLEEQNARLRVTLRSIGDAVITTDAQGRVEYLNPIAEYLTGWMASEALGLEVTEVFRVVHEFTRATIPDPVAQCLLQRRIVTLDDQAVLISRDGNEFGVEDSAAPIINGQGELLGSVLVFHDVTEQRRLTREMFYRATHDALTGLINRTEFEARLARALSDAQEYWHEHALLFIDLDAFKLVNDAGGHTTGDRLLCEIVPVLRSLLGNEDTLARLGGDEFGIILQHCGVSRAQQVAERICEQIEAHRFTHEAHRFHITASLGLVPINRDWPSTTAILQAADAACYTAKEGGRDRVHTYTEADPLVATRREEMKWVHRVDRALEEDAFELHWHRIHDLQAQDSGIHGEVLLRLPDQGRLVLPGAFLPAAERFHAAPRIDRWVVRRVCEWLARHRDQLGHLSTLAVNVSGQSLGDPSFQRYVTELLDRLQIQACKLCFEITETAAITRLDEAQRFIGAMRARGLRFALDDFGSGMSSFGYLKNLPVDYLKIDGQFIRDLLADPLNGATVRYVRDVAAIGGIKTIAEFVETEAVECALRELGIHYAQGHLRHRPEPLDGLLQAR